MNQPSFVGPDQSIANGMMNIMGMFDPQAIAKGKYVQAQTENLGEDTRGKRMTNDTRARRLGKNIYKRDANGNIVVGTNGQPILEDPTIEGDVLFGGDTTAPGNLVTLDRRGFQANNTDANAVKEGDLAREIAKGNAATANTIKIGAATAAEGRTTQKEKAEQDAKAAELKAANDLAIAQAKGGDKTGPLPVDTWGALQSKEKAWDTINEALLGRGTAFKPNVNIAPEVARQVTNRAVEYLRMSRGRLNASQALDQALKDFGATGGKGGVGNFGQYLFDGDDRASLVNGAGKEITSDMFADAAARLSPVDMATIAGLLGGPAAPADPAAAAGAPAAAPGATPAPAPGAIPPPASRPVGTRITKDGKTYEWNGTGWVLVR